MSSDIQIELTPGVRLSTLQATANFPEYNELLQRAVMLLLTSTDLRLRVDGRYPDEWFRIGTTSGSQAFQSMLGMLSNSLLSILNEEGTVAEAVTMSLDVQDNEAKLTINIVSSAGDTVTTTVGI